MDFHIGILPSGRRGWSSSKEEVQFVPHSSLRLQRTHIKICSLPNRLCNLYSPSQNIYWKAIKCLQGLKLSLRRINNCKDISFSRDVEDHFKELYMSIYVILILIFSFSLSPRSFGGYYYYYY